MGAALGGDESGGHVGYHVLVDDLCRAERRPAVLGRIRLEIIKGSVDRSREERQATDRVVEGRRRAIHWQLVEESDIRRLIKKLGLCVELDTLVATHRFRKRLIWIDRHRYRRFCAARDAKAQRFLHGGGTRVKLLGRASTVRRRGMKAGRRGTDCLELDFYLTVGTLCPDLDTFDAGERSGAWARGGVRGTARRRLPRRWAPEVSKVRQWDGDVNKCRASNWW